MRKSNLVSDFISLCKDNLNVAFIYKNKKIAYQKLYEDIFKMIEVFKNNNLNPGDKVLLFIFPSYNFYLTMLASIYYGLNIVVIDSFKDKKRVKDLIDISNIKYCFIDGKTNLLKAILPRLYFINIFNYKKNNGVVIDYINYGNTVLTTFTSGTTGVPKAINRSINDLEKQVNLLLDNICFDDSSTILCGLPIYMLLILILGKTAIIDNKINYKYSYDTVLMPIEKVLKNKNVNKNVKYMFLGGAILYRKEVERIKYLYPNANVNYVYGSSEGVLIAAVNLNDFNNLTFKNKILGIDVELVDGEIMISGDSILTESKSHLTGDLGFFNDNGLKILGRKKYSNADFYNYVYDEMILNENPFVKKGFSFWYNCVNFVYEGKLSVKRDNVRYYKFRKLPMDNKHKTKLDYNCVMKVIK